MHYGMIKTTILSCWNQSVQKHQFSSPWEKSYLPFLCTLQSLECLVGSAGGVSWVIFWKCLSTCNGYKNRQCTYFGNQLWILQWCFIVCYKLWVYDFYWRNLNFQESKTIVLLQQLKQVLLRHCWTFVALSYFYFYLSCINNFCLKGIWPFKIMFENF